MSENITQSIPVVLKSGIEYVNQAAEIHSITVIVSALSEAASLVSNARGDHADLREAEKCAQVALAYLAPLIEARVGSRVCWPSGYTTKYGTIYGVRADGAFSVVPDNADSFILQASEFDVLS